VQEMVFVPSPLSATVQDVPLAPSWPAGPCSPSWPVGPWAPSSPSWIVTTVWPHVIVIEPSPLSTAVQLTPSWPSWPFWPFWPGRPSWPSSPSSPGAPGAPGSPSRPFATVIAVPSSQLMVFVPSPLSWAVHELPSTPSATVTLVSPHVIVLPSTVQGSPGAPAGPWSPWSPLEPLQAPSASDASTAAVHNSPENLLMQRLLDGAPDGPIFRGSITNRRSVNSDSRTPSPELAGRSQSGA